MKELIKDNLITIVTYIYIFLVGVGAGGAITDKIWRIKDEENVHKSKTVAGDKKIKDSKNGRTDG